ncbi:hypothetical protein NFJ07_02110 [Arthrobacter sp. B2a2-09]|nr:hypothetical protein [Arthrobacter sp. B2a2-09]
MARRLTQSTEWKAVQTIAFPCLASPKLLDLAGPGVLFDLTGPFGHNNIWRFRDEAFTFEGMTI